MAWLRSFIRNISPCQQLPPKGLQIDSGGSSGRLNNTEKPLKQRVIRKVIANYAVGSGLGSTQTVTALLHNPSPRLSCVLSCGFELTNNVDVVTGASPATWKMQAFRKSAAAGVQALLNVVFSSRNLPDAYEIDSGLKEARLTVTLPNTAIGTGQSGALVMEALFEPNVPVDDDAELQRLLQEADLQVIGAPPTIQNTS